MRPVQLLVVISFLLKNSQSFLSANGYRIHLASALSLSKQTDADVLNDGDGTNQKKYTTLPRLYVGLLPTSSHNANANAPRLSQDLRLPLDSDQAHYVTKVMRIDGKKKSLLRLFDGTSGEWLARIDVEGSRNRITVHATCMQTLRTNDDNDGPWLLFAPLQNKARIKWLLEKCTELGASRFVPIQTERTVGGLRDVKKLALQLVEASEQCERLVLPTLSRRLVDDGSDDDEDDSLISLQDLLYSWETNDSTCKEDRHLLICRERSSVAVPVLQHLIETKTGGAVAFLVGPEGGWSPQEEDLLNEAAATCNRIHAVSLGSNVLRAETAATTAMAAYALFREFCGVNSESG